MCGIVGYVGSEEAAPILVDGLRRLEYRGYDSAGLAVQADGGIEIVRARVGFRVNNGDMMRDAAIAGLGIGLLPLFIAGPDIHAGNLKVVDVGVRPTPELIYLAHPEGRRPSAKLRALADHLKAAFGDPPYWEDGAD